MNAKTLAFCGVCAALNIVFMLAGSIFELFDLSILVICSLVTMLVVVECGAGAAWVFAAASSALAFILLPNKLYAIEYLLFAAMYPIVKMYFEKYRALFAWPLKLSFLDSALLLCVILGQYVFLMGDDYYSFKVITILIGTAFFILYDITLTACISVYMIKIAPRLKKKK